jgi:oxaloacetate decarboxylase alpha subunit
VHTLQTWVDMAKAIEDMGAHSLCIKDMAGLLHPYDAYDLVTRSIPASTALTIEAVDKPVVACACN